MVLLEIKDRWELLALHRALFEAKLHRAPEDLDVAGSPILARLAERVIDALIEVEEANGKPDARTTWTAWRQASNHPRRHAAIREAVESCSQWSQMTGDDRRSFVVDALSPLVGDDDLVASFIVEGDRYHEGPPN